MKTQNLSPQRLGVMGEKWVLWQLKTQYPLWNFRKGKTNEHCDIVATTNKGKTLKIEVKTARLNKENKWKFLLYKKGHTNHETTNVIILLQICRDCIVPYIVPTKILASQRQAVITSLPNIYSGKLSSYREQWENVQ